MERTEFQSERYRAAVNALPGELRRQALAYARHVATMPHYALRRAAVDLVAIVESEAASVASGGLIGLLAGEPLEGLKVGAIYGVAGYGLKLGFDLLQNFSMAWRTTSQEEKRAIGVLRTIDAANKITSGLSFGIYGVFFNAFLFGALGKLVSGSFVYAAAGAVYGAIMAIYSTLVGAPRLLNRVSRFQTTD